VWPDLSRRTFSLVDVIVSLISIITAGGNVILGITGGLEGEAEGRSVTAAGKVMGTLLPTRSTKQSTR